MKKLITLLCISIPLFSCQKGSTFTYREWNSNQESAQNALLKNIQLENTNEPVRYKFKKIEYNRQIFNGKPIYNSFIKKITSTGNSQVIQANFIEEKNLIANKTKTTFKNVNFLDEIRKLGADFEKATLISTEEILIVENKKPVEYTLVSYFDRTGVPYSSFFKPDGSLIRTERQGSQFADVNATIYTEGPKLSQLSEQMIKGLAINPTLSNNMVFVTTESDKKISSISPVLKFDTKDDRFDQLQVFYYLNKSFQWMKDNLQVEIPEKIEAVVHVGFPDKTNSAFYFQNKIRVGQGDGVNYSNIPHDASIIYHESFHALVDHLAHLPYEGEGGSLNEGFADFFTCLITERPYLGESSYLKAAYKRSLQLTLRLDEKNGGLYHDSQILSSLLWEVKEKISAEKAKSLAVETLIQLNGLSNFTEFNKKILLASNEVLSKEEQIILQQILKGRGFLYE